jgi:hypothetical protein
MFGFFTNLFKKKKKQGENGCFETGGVAFASQSAPDFSVDENISIQTDEEFPKVFSGKIESSGKDKVTVRLSEAGSDAAKALKADDNVQVYIRHDGETTLFRTKTISLDETQEKPVLIFKYPEQIIKETAFRKNVRVPANIPSRIALEGSENLWNMVHV